MAYVQSEDVMVKKKKKLNALQILAIEFLDVIKTKSPFISESSIDKKHSVSIKTGSSSYFNSSNSWYKKTTIKLDAAFYWLKNLIHTVFYVHCFVSPTSQCVTTILAPLCVCGHFTILCTLWPCLAKKVSHLTQPLQELYHPVLPQCKQSCTDYWGCQFVTPHEKTRLVSWCFEHSQPQRITSGLRKPGILLKIRFQQNW